MNSNRYLEKVRAPWINSTSSSELDDFALEVFKSVPLMALTETHNTVLYLFDMKQFKVEYVSKNIETVMGFDEKEFREDDIMIVQQKLDKNQKDFYIVMSQWVKDVLNSIPIDNRVNLRMSYCGLTFNHPTKQWMRLLLQHFVYEKDEDNLPTRICISFTDVTHLLKDSTLWFRINYGNDNQYSKSFNFNACEHKDSDIISNRQKEVLHLLAQDIDVVTIGKKLHISPHTVNNHRQNLLNQLGVRDTTALIQICRMCGIE
jgi:DNA-binding CsgD family transcriptional regulator